MSRRLALVGGLLALAAPAWAGSSGGTSAVPFLRLEQGARPTGMGGAFTAVADDANSIWWNPAGMARSELTEVTLSHTSFVEELKTQYIGLSRPMKSLGGTVGASVVYMSLPGIEGFDASKNSTGKLTYNGYAASLAYAAFLSPDITAGVNGKLIGQTMATEKGSGMAVDLGLQWRRQAWGAGIAFQNIGPTFKIAGTSAPLPFIFRGGASYSPNKRLTLAVDGDKARDGDFKIHLGGETRLGSNLAMRAGWQQLHDVGAGAGFTVGFSILGVIGMGGQSGWAGESTPWWESGGSQPVGKGGYAIALDYGFQAFGDLSEVHRFSLGVKF